MVDADNKKDARMDVFKSKISITGFGFTRDVQQGWLPVTRNGLTFFWLTWVRYSHIKPQLFTG